MQLSGRKLLVTGAHGMLAGALVPKLRRSGAELFLTDVLAQEKGGIRTFALDITDHRAVREMVSELQPDWIVNCAAYTKVDDAERQQELAFAINGTGPGNLAKAARTVGAALLHVSTDYVFGGHGAGARSEPYTEEVVPAPCGVYGHSKRLGDELVQAALPDKHLIVRTSWLHGPHGPNFIETILRIAKDREELRVVNDQIGSPTYAEWLAEILIGLIQKDAHGIFNATCRGGISWFDFAKEILAQAGMQTKVLPQSTEELGRPAPRPAYSVLSLTKLEQFMGIQCLPWQEGVRAHLAAVGVAGAAGSGS